jgi:hypothetical protein
MRLMHTRGATLIVSIPQSDSSPFRRKESEQTKPLFSVIVLHGNHPPVPTYLYP